MGTRVVIGNHKGGSGKTAYVVNTAAALAAAGKRVLVVDLDPQANASRRLAWRFDPANPVPTVSEAIKADAVGVAADAVYRCGWDGEIGDGIDLVPARFDLENRISEAGVVGAGTRLRKALEGVDDAHDVTLLDCPPSLGHLTQMALAAGDVAVCTVEPEYDSVEGAVRYRDFITGRGGDLGNPALSLIGFVVSRTRANVGAHAYQIGGLPDLFGADRVWSPHIPEQAQIKDAADAGVPLRQLGHPRAAEMAGIYDELAKRLVTALTAAGKAGAR
ncbi:ParA family protein [Actinoallomurus purpureus]|uniref:ParA family protein n=1 Tax=Actinoallomurus purpureus TaxID=478114 RepID=UPI002092D0E6|nr:ParA family protein [Actinoallomurus purpureus]MCO6011724.1 ParA family protein [Actinoallomurus purpureus]